LIEVALVFPPIGAPLKTVGGVTGLYDLADEFDYACSLARADAIDNILILVIEARGWSLDDEAVLDRVSVEHDGKTRARILVDGAPVTRWWQDRIETSKTDVTWHFEAHSATES